MRTTLKNRTKLWWHSVIHLFDPDCFYMQLNGEIWCGCGYGTEKLNDTSSSEG